MSDQDANYAAFLEAVLSTHLSPPTPEFTLARDQVEVRSGLTHDAFLQAVERAVSADLIQTQEAPDGSFTIELWSDAKIGIDIASGMTPASPGAVRRGEVLRGLLEAAWAELCGEVPSLLQYVSENQRIERALAFRLGVLLHKRVLRHRASWGPRWGGVVVDSELHMSQEGPKFGRLHFTGTEAPDLIIHERMSDDANLLVCEFKQGFAPDARDLKKLQALAAGPGRRYEHAWAVRLDKGRPLTVLRAIDGQLVEVPPPPPPPPPPRRRASTGARARR